MKKICNFVIPALNAGGAVFCLSLTHEDDVVRELRVVVVVVVAAAVFVVVGGGVVVVVDQSERAVSSARLPENEGGAEFVRI